MGAYGRGSKFLQLVFCFYIRHYWSVRLFFILARTAKKNIWKSKPEKDYNARRPKGFKLADYNELRWCLKRFKEEAESRFSNQFSE
ncbi:MAG TPA: hypothetical protein ENJ95_17890 [Bacteroidetes bacterium]|nr:hypothetical protein [Bacteroidota bacterium]